MNKKVEYILQYRHKGIWKDSFLNEEKQPTSKARENAKQYMALKTRIIKRTITEEVIE